MKEIQLTQGQVALVDDWNYEDVNQWKWYAMWDKHTKSFYAMRHTSKSSGAKPVLMHSYIAKTPKGMKTDHINHKTLDNQEANLRVCTNSQNLMSRGKQSNNTSGYKGVSNNRGKWRAQIRTNGKVKFLGYWDTPEDAAIAYDVASRLIHGEYGFQNFP